MGPISAKLPRKLRNNLLLECGGLCPVPHCTREIWDFFPLNCDLTRENLLPLCHIHYSMAEDKKLSIEMLRTIRNLLRLDRFPTKGPSIRIIPSRDEYLREMSRQIFFTGNEFFITYVGPLCLHPDWYFEKRDEIIMQPNMDRPIRDYLRAYSDIQDKNIKIIFRNTRRYYEKVKQIISPEKCKILVNDIFFEIDRIWSKKNNKGMEICCVDTGYLHIPTIFKKVAITAFRLSEKSPIEEGALYLDEGIVELEKKRFNQIFDSNFEGIEIELKKLKDFLYKLIK